jgi:hypothetical protein
MRALIPQSSGFGLARFLPGAAFDFRRSRWRLSRWRLSWCSRTPWSGGRRRCCCRRCCCCRSILRATLRIPSLPTVIVGALVAVIERSVTAARLSPQWCRCRLPSRQQRAGTARAHRKWSVNKVALWMYLDGIGRLYGHITRGIGLARSLSRTSSGRGYNFYWLRPPNQD